jgi:hypothetical protein
MVEVLEHEGAEGSEAGLAAAQVPQGGNQQVGLLLGRREPLQQLQELLVAGHAQGEPLVQQRPAASLRLGEASIALGDTGTWTSSMAFWCGPGCRPPRSCNCTAFCTTPCAMRCAGT